MRFAFFCGRASRFAFFCGRVSWWAMARSETGGKAGTVVIESERPAVLEAVTDFAATIERASATDEDVLDLLASLEHRLWALKKEEIGDLTSPHIEQLRAQADLRARFMIEVAWLGSTDIARLYETDPARWKAEGRIFSITEEDVDHYPIFQFADGQPVPAMSAVLQIFTGLSDWQVALWFFAPNAWLEDRRPMDVLLNDPDAVIDAARHAVEAIEV